VQRRRSEAAKEPAVSLRGALELAVLPCFFKAREVGTGWLIVGLYLFR
jgi:hypothetical protein